MDCLRRVAATTIVALLIAGGAAGCSLLTGGGRGEFLGQSLTIDNDLGIPVQITYEGNGREAPEIAVNRDTAELKPTEAYGFIFDTYDVGNKDHCTRGIIRARASDGTVVAVVPSGRCLARPVVLSEFPPPPAPS